MIKLVLKKKKKQNRMDLLKQKIKAALSKQTYDINKKRYDGLVYIELLAAHLQQQLNRHGNVTIMVRFKCWVVSKKQVKDLNILLLLDNLNVVNMMT